MRYFLFVFLFSVITSLSTCKKDDPLVIPVVAGPNPSVLETVWSQASPYFSTKPIINSQGDVLVSEMFNSKERGEVFKLLDQYTGSIKWTWKDYFVLDEVFTSSMKVRIDDILIMTSGRYNYALNISTGQTVWRNSIDSLIGEPQIYKDEDGYIYKGFSSKSQSGVVYIFRAKYTTGDWELVCTYKDPHPIEGRFEVASIGVTPNSKGEKIVAFSIYTYYPYDPDSTKALIIGYNMATRSFDWVKNYRLALGEFSVFMYSNFKGMVYSFAANGLQYCIAAFDANTGQIAWQKKLPNYGVGLYMYKENVIVTSAAKSPVYCFNQQTGNLVWEQTYNEILPEKLYMFGFDFDDSKVYKHYLLSTQCDYLLVLNANNGALVFYDYAALPEGCLQNGLDVDEQRRVFYAEDRKRIVCYKLPKEMR